METGAILIGVIDAVGISGVALGRFVAVGSNVDVDVADGNTEMVTVASIFSTSGVQLDSKMKMLATK